MFVINSIFRILFNTDEYTGDCILYVTQYRIYISLSLHKEHFDL